MCIFVMVTPSLRSLSTEHKAGEIKKKAPGFVAVSEDKAQHQPEVKQTLGKEGSMKHRNTLLSN
jgi:hypothetical protein